jgi:hypothetical protein
MAMVPGTGTSGLRSLSHQRKSDFWGPRSDWNTCLRIWDSRPSSFGPRMQYFVSGRMQYFRGSKESILIRNILERQLEGHKNITYLCPKIFSFSISFSVIKNQGFSRHKKLNFLNRYLSAPKRQLKI